VKEGLVRLLRCRHRAKLRAQKKGGRRSPRKRSNSIIDSTIRPFDRRFDRSNIDLTEVSAKSPAEAPRTKVKNENETKIETVSLLKNPNDEVEPKTGRR